MSAERFDAEEMRALRKKGLRNSDIAKYLGCSEQTVRRKIGPQSAAKRRISNDSLLNWLNAFPKDRVFYITNDWLTAAQSEKPIFIDRGEAERYAKMHQLLFFFKCYITKGTAPKLIFTFERVRHTKEETYVPMIV